MLRRFLALLVLGSLLLAACGGDDGDGSDGAGEGDGGGDSDIGLIDSAQCAEVAAAMAAAAGAMPAALSGSSADLEQSIEQMQSFAEAAPEAIRADMQVIAEGYARVAQVLADADFDPAAGEPPPPEVIAQFEEISQELDSAEFQAAVENVNAYFEGGCEG
jgi:hypothetical protein